MVGRLTVVLLLAATLPRAACAEVIVVPTVSLVVKDDVMPPIEPKKRYFKFRSSTRQEPVVHIVPPPIASADDPTLAGATLVVYNTGGVPQTVSIELPASQWTIIGTAANFKGYHFHSDNTAVGPVTRVFVKPDKLFVRGGKTNWTYLLGPDSQGSIAARLTLGEGTTWCSETPAKPPSSMNDTPSKFVGFKGSVPASCPALP
jgi:hypothetical protein